MNDQPQSYGSGDDASTSSEVEVSFVRECELVYRGQSKKADRITSSRDVNKLVRKIIPNGPREQFVAIFLDAKSRPLGFYRVSGTLSAVAISPADILSVALRANCASLVVAHNHPSDEVTPSAEDVALTERLERSATIIGLKFLDHVIVALGTDQYFSFLDGGLVSQP